MVCDTYDQWYHTDCQDVHSRIYTILNDDNAIRWDCIVCTNPNFSTVCFDLPFISTDNHYIVSFQSAAPVYLVQMSIATSNWYTPLHQSVRNTTKSRWKIQNPSSALRILNINCQSFKKKQDRIENTIDSTKPDVIVVTEICLDPFTTDNQPSPQKTYKLRLKARQSGTGRGVLLAITNNFIISDVPELQTDCLLTLCRGIDC